MDKNLRRFSIMLFLLLSVSYIGVLAEPTQQFNNIKMTPYYFSSLPANTNQTMWININPPDNISSMISVLFHFKAFTSGQTTNYTLYVNDKLCGVFTISTTFANSGQNEIAFDCTNLISGIGNYTIKLKSNVNAGSFFGWVDLVYVNKPLYCGNVTGGTIDSVSKIDEGKMSVHGTEYIAGDNGKVWLSLVSANDEWVDDATCVMNIFNPDSSYLYKDLYMISLGHHGVYYYDFIVPITTGVYPCVVVCYYSTNTQIELANSGWIATGTNVQNDYTKTQVLDTTYWKINEALSGGNYRIDYGINITDVATPNVLLLNVAVGWNGRWNGTENLVMSLYNYSSSSWFNLPNEITNTGVDLTFTNTLEITNATESGILSDSNMRFRITDKNNTDASMSQVWNNYIDIKLIKLTQPTHYYLIRGSTELHVGSGNISYVGNVSHVDTVGDANISFYELKYAGGTEYLSGTEGQIAYQFLRTIAGNPNPINDGNCNSTIWFPNNTIFLGNQSITFLTGSSGLYYNNFSVPTTNGVYKTQAICNKGGIFTYGASTFHVEDTLYNNQQTIYSFLQTMNTTMVSGHNYISSLVQNVSTQITDSWTTFWNSVSARITS